MEEKHSRAQIVATLGPASGELEIIKKMIDHQTDCFRINFSHGDYEQHLKFIKLVKEASKGIERKIVLIQDLSGPREKTGSGHKFDESSLAVITEKDKDDLRFGLNNGVDYVALSFVGDYKDVLLLRTLMKEIGIIKPIIAKIERREAVENIDGIIEMADAIMVARGDLGEAYPLEKLPYIQALIIKKCNQAGKPVITATQMMLSMMNSRTPTRAEVSDVAHAILDGSDAVMLSEETAIGKYPVETVEFMEKIILEAEDHTDRYKFNLL